MHATPDLRWFVAVLVFESSIEERREIGVSMFNSALSAPDATSAYMRSLTLGREDESAYGKSRGT